MHLDYKPLFNNTRNPMGTRLTTSEKKVIRKASYFEKN